MKTWFWTLVVFVAAVLLALFLHEHSGNVLVIAPPWRVELSLTLAVLLLLVLFIVVHTVLRVSYWLGQGPGRFRHWRHERATQRDYELLESGWLNVLEGRFPEAEKDLARLMGCARTPERKVLASLAAARAAHHQGEFNRRDQALSIAREGAGTEVRLLEVISAVSAEMYLDQNKPKEALELLKPLQDASSRDLHTTRLLLRAHRQLRHYQQVYELTRILLRRGVIEDSEARNLIETSTAARLHEAGLPGFKAIWSDLKSDERLLPDIALAAASIHSAAGQTDEAARFLEASLASRLDSRLLALYAQCTADRVERRLTQAETWLKSHPEDPDLLVTLGTLCLTGNLWGQAEHYLVKSLQIRPDLHVHALLGNLYDSLGRTSEALTHWRQAAGITGAVKVTQPTRPLPAADMRSDPKMIDGAHAAALASHSDPSIPVAASAADFTADDLDVTAVSKSDEDTKSTSSSPRKTASADHDGLDEYFDSAPIPGIDLPHVSDRARRD